MIADSDETDVNTPRTSTPLPFTEGYDEVDEPIGGSTVLPNNVDSEEVHEAVPSAVAWGEVDEPMSPSLLPQAIGCDEVDGRIPSALRPKADMSKTNSV